MGQAQLLRSAAGFFLAIIRSRSAVLCGRREPCSQLCTAFGLTQRKCANTTWLACRLSRIRRISAGLSVAGGAGICVTRKSTVCPRSYAKALASDCRISSEIVTLVFFGIAVGLPSIVHGSGYWPRREGWAHADAVVRRPIQLTVCGCRACSEIAGR